MFIKNKINFTVCPDITFNGFCLNVELHAIKIQLPIIRPRFVMGICRPPDGNMNMFSKALNDLSHSLDKYTKADIFIGGYFIIDFSKMGGSRKILKDLELCFGLRGEVEIAISI